MSESPASAPSAPRPLWKPLLAGGCLGMFLGAFLLMAGFLVAYNFFYEKSVTAMAEAKVLEPVRLRADFAWTATGTDGALLDLQTLQGRPVFLHLWRPECVSCVAEIPGINALFQEFQGQGVAFVSVALDAGGDLDAALVTHDVQFPVYTLPAGKLPDFIETRATPTTYIIDAAGFVVYAHTGAVNWDTEDARAFLERLAETP